MRTATILRRLDVGSDVAETDDRLAQSFVDTSDFADIVGDRCDVILGVKGTGKSAMFRRLSDETVELPALARTDIVPAFNTQGSVIFRKLARATTAAPSERELALLWYAYLCAVLGNHLVSTYGDTLNASVLRDVLSRYGLLVPDADTGGLFERVLLHASALLSNTTIEGDFTLSAGPASAKLRASTSPNDRAAGHFLLHEDFDHLFHECERLLELLGRRCWVIFDRLDEAFHDTPDLEREALRGLLRTKIDLNAYGPRVGVKIFLRSDVLDRISQESGFVNATHLRQLHLRWDEPLLQALIAYRLAYDPTTRRHLGLRERDLHSEKGHKRICRRLFPQQIDGLPYMAWVREVTTDATELPNPRNVITLLQLARRRQLRADERVRRNYDPKYPLIRLETWRVAARDLSETRLNDTILAEAADLRPLVDRLQRRVYLYSRAQLAHVLELPVEGDAFRINVGRLKYYGLLKEDLAGSYEVPRLYRPALRLLQARLKTRSVATVLPGGAEKLERVAKDMVARVDQTGTAETTGWLDERQRRFFHEEVAALSENVSTESGPDRGDGRKRVTVVRNVVDKQGPNGFRDRPQQEDDDDLVGDETMAELHGYFEQASASIRVHGNRWFVTPPLLHYEANILAALAREQSSPANSFVRVVGLLCVSSTERSCVFMKDVPFARMDQQEEFCQSERGRRFLRSMIDDCVAVVRTRRVRMEVRPMSDRMIGQAAAELAGRTDVDFRLMGATGSYRVAISPVLDSSHE